MNQNEQQNGGPWKCGNEFLPFHPQASHVNPDYRDGWNACYRAALSSSASEPVAWRDPKCPRHVISAADKRDFSNLSINSAVTAMKVERYTEPLYLSASPLPQEVKALTEERIADLWSSSWTPLSFARAIERELRGAQEVKAGECGKSLNALAADLLRPYLKPGQKVIWREAFRWHDDSGVLPSHYDGMELPALAEDFGYDWEYAFDFKHAAIVWKKGATLKESADSRGEKG